MSFYNDASLVFLPSGGAGKDGKAYSIKPVPEYGTELITNGGFNTDSDWNKGTGWTISGGTANCDGTQTSTSQLRTSVGLSIQNTLVKFSFEVKNYSAGTLAATIEGTGGNEFSGINSNGFYTIQATSSDSIPRIAFNANSSFIGSIDNVSVKEVIVGDGDFNFNRGSNLTATRVDSNGLIEKGRENLLLQSNSFDTTWTLSSTSVTSGQAGYDGSNDAWLLNSTTTGFPRIAQNVTSSGVATYSVYAKPATDGFINMRTFGADAAVWFNLNDGVVVNASGSQYVSSKVESVGDGWYRCSVIVNGSLTSLRIYPASSYGLYSTSGNGVYIQDAQLEQGLVATEYIESGASTGLAGILEDSPRFDYSSGASCPSLLLEPQRSNIVGFTEYFEGGNWGVGGSTGLQLRTSTPSPDGNNGVYLVTSEEGNPSSRVQYNLGVLGNDHIFSVFIKGTGSATRIRLRNNTSGIHSVVYDIDSSGNFTLNTESAHDGYYGAEPYSNGWHRVYLKVETNGGANNFMQIFSDVVDADGSIYVWGAQAEEGSYITSYIPNHSGGSVTRGADETQQLILNDDLTSVVWFGEITAPDVVRDSSQRLLEMGKSGTQYNAFYAYRNNSTNERRATFYTRNASGTQTFIAEAATDRVKFAMQYNAANGSIKVYINGSNALASPITDLDYTEFEKFKLSGVGGVVRVHQFIALKATYTDAELTTLTS